MTSPQQPVLLIGGTRGTGRLIAQLLRHRGIPVRVLARDPSRAREQLDGSIEIVAGDLIQPESLAPAIDGARAIVFTAGVRSGHPASERNIKAVEYDGVLNTLAEARKAGFAGRFLYMTASGATVPSFAGRALNLWKGNTLVWRHRAEAEIRSSGLEYTVIRAGVLLNQPGGRHRIVISQNPLPLSPRYRIAREDVAEIFNAALEHPKAARATFEAIWGPRGEPGSWSRLLDGLTPDEGHHSAVIQP